MRIPNVAAALATIALCLSIPLAQAEVVVVVSAKNPVASLTKSQVAQIFLAKSVSFPEGGTAVPVDLAEGAARAEFYSKVTGKEAAQLRAYWSQLTFSGKAQRPREAANAGEARKLVAASPTMIGYLPAADVDGSVRVVFKP